MLKRCLCILLHTALVHNSNLYSTELYSSIEHLSNWRKSNNFISKQKHFGCETYLYCKTYINSIIFDYLFPTYLKEKNMHPTQLTLSQIPKRIKYCLRKQEEYEKKIFNSDENFLTNFNNIASEDKSKIVNNTQYKNNNNKKYKNIQLYSNNNDMLCDILESQINNLQYTNIPKKKKKLNKNINKITTPKEDVKDNISDNNQVFNDNKTDIVENTISNNCEEINISNNEINNCIENINNNNESINEDNKNKTKVENIKNNSEDLKDEEIIEVNEDKNSINNKVTNINKINCEENEVNIINDDNISEKTTDTQENNINENNNIKKDVNNNEILDNKENQNNNNMNNIKIENDCNEEEVQDDDNSIVKPPKNKQFKKLTAKEIKAKQLANKRKRKKQKKIANQKENEVSQNENIEHNNNTKSIQEENNKNEIKIDIKNNEEQEDTKINENQLNNIKNDNLYSNKIINDSIQKNKILIDSINNIIITDETTEDDKIEDNDKENEEQQTNKKKKKKNKNRYKFIKEEKNTIDDKIEDKENKKIQKKQLKKEQKLKEQEEEKKRQQKIEFNKNILQNIEMKLADFDFYLNKIEYKNTSMQKNNKTNKLYQGVTKHFDKVLYVLMDYFYSNLENKPFEEFTNEEKSIISLSHTIIELQVFNKNEYNNDTKSNKLLINIMMNAGIESCKNSNDLVKWIHENTTKTGKQNINLKLFVKFMFHGVYNMLDDKISAYQQKVYTKIYNHFKPIISYINKYEIIFRYFKEQRKNSNNILNNDDREYLIKEYSKSLLPVLHKVFSTDNYVQLREKFSDLLLNIIMHIKSNKYISNLFEAITTQMTNFMISSIIKNIDIANTIEVNELQEDKINKFFESIKDEINKENINKKILDFISNNNMNDLYESKPDFMKEDTENNEELDKKIKISNCEII